MPVDKPAKSTPSDARWSSDYLADVMRALGVEYIALTPGASYRGLQRAKVGATQLGGVGILGTSRASITMRISTPTIRFKTSILWLPNQVSPHFCALALK